MTKLDGAVTGAAVARTPNEAAKADEAGRAQVQKLAQEFESMMLLQMIRQMRSSMLDDTAQEEGLGNSEFTDTVDTELAGMLSRSGGFGLGRYMLDAFERQAGAIAEPPPVPGLSVARSTVTRVDVPSAPRGTPSTELASALPVEGVVTSPYGWRSDPFHGAARFHAGVDIRAAYGQEVPVAAAGRVVFAGERGGYGNLVVVEHADGYESRYAHLASIDVAVGQPVNGGEVLGRAGRTGRATAPHLHFEVLRHGERVDPASATRDLAGWLKTHDAATINVSSGNPRAVLVEGADE